MTIIEDQIAILTKRAKDLATAEDSDLPRFLILVDDIRRSQSEALGEIITTVKREMLKRMKERGAEAIPDKEFEVSLDRQYTPYEYDIEKLRQARALLPDEEAKKILKFVPEHTVVVPAKWEPGAAVSIKALAKKYRKTYVSDLLLDGLRRTELEPRVVVKQRKTIRTVSQAPPSVTGASA